MSVPINGDLLSIMLLYSLPKDFENFRCAIECRDELPTADVLKVKIIEESEARKIATGNAVNAMYTTNSPRNHQNIRTKYKHHVKPEFRCFRCHKLGHKASMCGSKNKSNDKDKSDRRNHEESYAAFYINEAADLSSDVVVAHAAQVNKKVHKWILDSGCTAHLCCDKESFCSLNDDVNAKINLASAAHADVKGKGSVKLSVVDEHNIRAIELKNTLFVPDLRINLVSIAKITDRGHSVVFNKSGAYVYNEDGNITMKADRCNDLFVVREGDHCAMAHIENSELMKWHCCLGHLNINDMIKLMNKQIIPKIDITNKNDIVNCVVCAKGKMVAKPFNISHVRCKEILGVVHSDVVGPFRVESINRERYFVTFIDEFSRWCQIYFLREKSDVFNAFKLYHKFIENQTEKRIKYLHTDNGREYINSEFDKYLVECGIGRRNTIPKTPQQNGIAERYNRTIMDMTRCLLLPSGLGDSFWSIAVSAACYLRNRCPSSILNGSTPYELMFKRKPNLSDLHIFGTKVMVRDKDQNKSKLAPRAFEGVFVGYPHNRKGYRVWLPERRKIIDARDLKFIDDKMNISTSFPNEINSNSNVLSHDFVELTSLLDNVHQEERVSEEVLIESDTEEKRGPGRPKLLRTGARGRPRKIYSARTADEEEEEQNDGELDDRAEEVFIDAEDDVFSGVAELNIKTVLKGPESDEWFDAIEAEVASILKHDTWDVVKIDKDVSTVGCRFVLTNKCSSDGAVIRRKARLVAKGYSQQYGVNYYDTFAPVARLETVRLLLALAVHFDLKIWQFDVVTAYLNGVLDDIVYMNIPELLPDLLERIAGNRAYDVNIKKKAVNMLDDLKRGGNACMLKKALYGLKQAGRQWYIKLRSKLEDMGLRPTKNEPCLFIKDSGENLLLLLVYVDDLLVASQNKSAIDEVCRHLLTCFQVKDLGLAKYCLGLEIIQNNSNIILKQQSYITNLLKQYGMLSCNKIATPAETNMHSHVLKKEPYDGGLYRELIGSLMYLSVASRPDIANVVSRLAQFVNEPLQGHWQAAKRVLRYLAGTAEIGLIFVKNHMPVTGYADADWGGCVVDRRSYTGYIFLFSGAAIVWKAQKQRTVALSSTEAEYISLTEAAKEAIYLRSLLAELGLSNLAKITIFVDNKGAQFLASDPVYHARTKHIDIRFHFVREALVGGVFTLEHIPTNRMVADICTKPLSRVIHERCSEMGMTF